MAAALPPGWKEVDPDFFYEHETGCVVYRSASGFLERVMTGKPGSEKWRANKLRLGGAMLEEMFDSKEDAMEAVFPQQVRQG